MKKKILKVSFYLLLLALTVYILVDLFQKQGTALLHSLLYSNWFAIGLALLFALTYTVLEGCITTEFVRRYQPAFSRKSGILNGFYVAFHKVITFGTGSIVAMMVHLKRYGVPPEISYGLGTTQYVMHRIAVTLYATVCILLEHDFVNAYFEDYKIFIYCSYGVTVAVALCLLGICLSRRIHRLILGILRRLRIQQRYPQLTDALEDKMTVLQRQTALLLQSKRRLCRVFLLEMLKLSCWFVIPYLALWGIGALNGLSLSQVISVIAIVTVLVGVIPTPGNIASIELIYILLFTVVVGEVAAGSTMLVYRFATFYLPFLVGMVVTLILRLNNIRHET